MTRPPPICSRLAALDGGGEHTLCLYAPVHEAGRHLSALEAAAVSRAVPKRRNEYATGRWLAHRALRELGVTVPDLLNGSRREPLWPEGVVGSIAHSDLHAMVVVSRDPALAGVGVDVERLGRLHEELLPKILTERERAGLGETDPTLMFSIKESVYKLLFPIVRDYVDFLEVEVELDLSGGRFALRYIGDKVACHCIEQARGRFLELDGAWVTRVILERT